MNHVVRSYGDLILRNCQNCIKDALTFTYRFLQEFNAKEMRFKEINDKYKVYLKNHDTKVLVGFIFDSRTKSFYLICHNEEGQEEIIDLTAVEIVTAFKIIEYIVNDKYDINSYNIA